MIPRRHQPLPGVLPLFLAALVLIGNSPGLFAQNKPSALPQNFGSRMSTQRKYYDAPDQDKVKLEVTGDKATNVAAGALISVAKITTFSVTGAPQLIAETPDCILDTSTPSWQINSTNVLHARSGDGNFYVEGVGFLWQQTAPDLTLSNRVHSILRQFASTNSAAARTNPAPSQTDVYSDDATFDMKGGLIIYRHHALVVDPRLHLTCAILNVQLTQGGANNQLDHILAETNVVIDYTDESGRKTHATGDKALYTRTIDSVTNEILTLTGHPRVETTNGWSTADIFVMNKTTGRIHGSGNCRFHYHPAAETAGGKTTNAPETLIVADNFDYDKDTGLTVFRDHVHADNPELKLACDTLTASMPQGVAGTNNLQHIVAENHVAIDYFDEHGEKTHATSKKAVYTSTVVNGITNQMLDLTGNPVLERTNAWMMADLISMDRGNGTIRGEGNQHTIFKQQPGKVGANTPPRSAETEIFSDHFDFNRSNGLAFYRGHARVINPEMRLQSRQLTIKLPEGADTNHAGRPDRIVAETNVIVDYFAEKGEKTHATGEKMVFTRTVTNRTTTNEVLELTGNPIVDMTSTNGQITHATGDKVVHASTVTGSATNKLVTLSGHPRIERPDGTMTSDDVIVYDPITGQARGVGDQNHIIYTIKSATPPKTNLPPAALNTPRP